MSSLSQISLPKPKNWQTFEDCTRVLFANILNDPNTQQNGRSGQNQCGVDVYGYRDRNTENLVGVQCKKKYETEVTVKELREEVGKAKTFVPAISEFILVTTAPRDQKIQKAARVITKELAEDENSFSVVVWGWEDIEEHAAQYDEAWKAFDPTYNPFAERGFEKLSIQIESIKQELRPSLAGTTHQKLLRKDIELSDADEHTPLHGKITALQKLVDDEYAQAALEQFEELKKFEWTSASRSERYRLLVGIASAKLKLGEEAEAGNILVDAYNECPEHKKAETNKATGLLLNKKNKEAVALAQEILAKDENNALAASTLIHALVDDDDCLDPLERIPETIRDSEEVLIAYIHFERCRNLSKWIGDAKDAYQKYPKSLVLKRFAAEAILDQLVEFEKDALAGGTLKSLTSQELSDAIHTLYTDASTIMNRGGVLYPFIANNVAMALRFADEHEKAKGVLDYSLRQFPDDEDVKIQRAIIAICENDPQKVINLLSEKPKNPEGVGLLVRSLEAIGRQKDAIRLIEEIDDEGLPAHVVAEFIISRVKYYAANGESQSAINLVKGKIAQEPNEIIYKIVLIRSFLEVGDTESALETFDDTLSQVDDTTNLSSRLELSFLARKLGMENVIVDLLKDWVATDRESDGLTLLLSTVINLGFWATARELFDKIPDSLRQKGSLLKAEAIFFINVGEKKADKRVSQYLRENPNDTQMILARIGIWQSAGREGDIKRFLEKIELSKLTGKSEECIQVAKFYAHYQDKAKAMVYAYSILMDNWDQPETHLAYQGLIFLNDDFGELFDAPVVGENTVVCLNIEGNSRRYRIENRRYGFFNEERLTSEDDLAVLLLGESPGEEVVIQDRIGEIRAKIEWVKSVFLDAFHCSLEQFNERFPRAEGLFRFKWDPESQRPPEGIESVVKARVESDKQMLHEYHAKGFPLAFVASLIGKDPVAAWEGLPKVGVKFQVCRGTLQERQEAIQIIERNEGKGCVLDAIALSIIRRLGIEEAVVGVCGQLCTTQSVVDLMANRANEAKYNVGKSQGFLTWQNGKLCLEKYPEELYQQVADECAKEIDWIRQKIAVLPAIPTHEPEIRARAVINKIGHSICDPAIAAEGAGLLLLSEDFGYRLWAAEVFNISTAWIQPVLIVARGKGLISDKEYCEAINDLAMSGHTFISLDPFCLMHQAQKDSFNVSVPLSKLFEMVGGPSADIPTNCGVMSSFLDGMLAECQDEMKVFKIASEIYRVMTGNRPESFLEIINLIYFKMKYTNKRFKDHTFGWIVGHVTDRPNGATHDRPKGATLKWPFPGFGEG